VKERGETERETTDNMRKRDEKRDTKIGEKRY
jgi:hypothetical protein